MSHKESVFRISVTYEDAQTLMSEVDASYQPLFEFSQNVSVHFQIRGKQILFKHGKITVEKQFRDIKKTVVLGRGIVLYFKDGTYIPFAVGNDEKHNTTLFDIMLLLKRRCPFRCSIKEKLQYPEYENCGDRYKTEEEPFAKISFVLTDAEINSLIMYERLIEDNLWLYLALSIAFIVLSFILSNSWLLIPAAIFTAMFAVMYFSSNSEYENYRQNHQGSLSMLLYSDVVVIRLRLLDIDIEYKKIRKPHKFLCFWILPAGDFYKMVLPIRIVKDNKEFFDLLLKQKADR